MKGEIVNIGGTCTFLVRVSGQNIGYPMSAILRNLSAGTVYLGGQGVTTATGFPLATDEFLEIDLVNESLFAVATVTTSINILRRGD